ncbi:MAG: ATP-binding protein, partial [Deltaproteobacteria bacterium]|nr:ATP-binding protein [Deltaproteobacteria bacterium]
MAQFGPNFLADHAGQIIGDPRVAVMELLANSSDAGALNVRITWPSDVGGAFSIEDDGIGMTREELLTRWETLCYDRRTIQGLAVIFPPEVVQKPARSLFGRNGKGRHGAFCFGDAYEVETHKDGHLTRAKVEQVPNADSPFRTSVTDHATKAGHGTKISTIVSKSLISEADLRNLIGSKFLMDPSFTVFLNSEKITFTDVSGIHSEIIEIDSNKKVEVLVIGASHSERSNRLRGVAWWVNNRLVGSPSWSNPHTGVDYLDGRTSTAKKYGFVIKADLLDQFVTPDWLGFRPGPLVTIINEAVDAFVRAELDKLLFGTRKETKKTVVDQNKAAIANLTPISRKRIGTFIDEIQQKCISIKESDLSNAVTVFAKLEQARTGYDLLRQLATCPVDDLERWNDIMSKWSATQAELVLDELDRRLKLIDEMERLVHDRRTDELHELQPLFEKGLWIFGPQYESVEFCSNRQLRTIIRKFQNGEVARLDAPLDRPDLVTGPVGVWDAHSYGADGEVSGISKVLIVELKKGGFKLTSKELDQAKDYALELKRASAVDAPAQIECFVLGSTLDPFASLLDIPQYNIKVTPRTYETILRQANARIFNIRKRIENLRLVEKTVDADVEEIIGAGIQEEFVA